MFAIRSLVILCALALSACATTSFERTTALKAGTEIGGSNVVFYSFLGIREGFFGPDMLAMMNAQLTEQMRQRGVNARVVMYEHKPVDKKLPSLLMLGVNRDFVTVPMKEYIDSQRPMEEKNNEKYRVIIFPTMVTTMGANVDSQIAWTLSETKSDAPLWTTKQNTNRTVWWSNDEAPETRSKQFVEGVIAQMTASGLFGADAQMLHKKTEDEKKEANKPKSAM